MAILGAGIMGTDHVTRIHQRISGARVSVVADIDAQRAAHAAASAGARVELDPLAAIAADDVDAVVLATPGPSHAAQLHACLDAGRPVLCEKPLTTDPADALAIVRREHELGRRLIQVGFMRRFDPEYAELKAAILAGVFGTPLLLHCVHRNAASTPGATSASLVRESLVHEVDATRFLLGEEITAITVRAPASSALAPAGLRDPQIAQLETASGAICTAEIFLNSDVGYHVRAEIVGERGSAMIGGRVITSDYRERFADAYDQELQRWVDAVRAHTFVDGPDSWDGYAAAVVCEAGVRALETGTRVEITLAPAILRR